MAPPPLPAICELLALSTSQPTALRFSLHTLASRGSETGIMHDGWGVAFYQGADVALFREPMAASGSALVRYLESDGPSTHLAISHIRHATRGDVQLSNTQPFVRELGGRTHVFAHNGDLPGIEDNAVRASGPYRPIGQTDSEHAFCALLAMFAADLRALGPANFFYADGDALFVHSHRRMQQASGRVEAPGCAMDVAEALRLR